MHKVAGQAMLSYAIKAAETVNPDRIIVVVGPGMEAMSDIIKPHGSAVQLEAKGTGDAVKAGLQGIEPKGNVLVMFGDTPLVTPFTLRKLLERKLMGDNPAIIVSGMTPPNPTGYGRLIVQGGTLIGIVEEKEATGQQKQITLCNGGIMLFDGKLLPDLLAGLSNENSKGEYYLTDTIALARSKGHVCAHVEIANEDVLGVNSRTELAAVEAVMQKRLRKQAMDGGVTLTDPDTVFLSADTRLGMDVTIGPNVFIGPGVTVGNNVEIRSFCHIEQTTIGAHVSVGPFARLRGGSEVQDGAHIGNFVELKGTSFGAGAKAGHLTYLGDASVGANVNIGAGTITCNYNGFTKSRTEIGAGAFIGSNTSLVAPIKIGADALVGAGSVITSEVPADALALERNPQKMAPNRGMASRRRERQ